MAINGFSVCNPGAVGTFKVPGTGIRLAVRREVAPLLIGFAAEFNRLVEPLDGRVMDCWGYNCRRVRGRATVSFHAAGIAIDLNATKHVLGRRNTFTVRQRAVIRRLCAKYGLRWGGSFSRPDDMHFEVIVPRVQALTLARTLQASPTTKTGASVPALSKLAVGARNAEVTKLQRQLKAVGFDPGGTDGVYGPMTKRAVARFQRAHNLSVDGIVGPQTLKRLF